MFLYPLLSSMLNSQTQTQMISNYEQEMKALEEQEKEALRAEAERYNDFVADLEGLVTDEMTEDEKAANEIKYTAVLGVGEAIGHLEIPKLEVDLPIYRGTSEAALQRGVGHLERSSLPIGGDSTHAVLTGHRGLPSSRLFRDLDKLTKGDIFILHTLDEQIAYETESVQIVLPHEVEALKIQEGRDLCTLVTCEPYIINSHRMLVTGHRVDYDFGHAEQGETISFFEKYIEYFMIVGAFTCLILAVALVRKSLKNKKSRVQVSGRDAYHD